MITSISLFISIVSLPSTPATLPISGKVLIDGSSTVFPISEAVGEDFQKKNLKVKVSIASSGTGGGFKKFCNGETDFSGASRPIEPSEIGNCQKNKVQFVELPVAYDGIAIVVNKANTWAKTLTTAELKKIWEPGSKVSKWSDIRADFPKTKISLYGPGPEHGTFDYFTGAIMGKEKSIRTDFNAANPEAIVTAVKGDKSALAYFGFSYYFENKDHLTLLAVDAGRGAILPTSAQISAGTYPLSRPIFIYASAKSLERSEAISFARYYIESSPVVVPQVGYATLDKKLYALVAKRLENKILGTMYTGKKDLPLSKLLLTSK